MMDFVRADRLDSKAVASGLEDSEGFCITNPRFRDFHAKPRGVADARMLQKSLWSKALWIPGGVSPGVGFACLAGSRYAKPRRRRDRCKSQLPLGL